LGAAARSGVPLRLTPIVPIVFHTGPNPWGVERELGELFRGPEELRAWAPRWAVRLWDLADQAPAELLASGEPWWQALAVVRNEWAATEEFADAVGAALGGMQSLAQTDPVRWEQLAKLVLYWAILRRPRAEWERVLAAIRHSQNEAELLREVEQMAETIGRTWEQELQARGQALGELRMARQMLRTVLRERFPTLPEELQQRIDRADVVALEAATKQAVHITSLDELRI
jgi:hypothetical protein